MPCTYTIKGGSGSVMSYEELLNALSEYDLEKISDLLFSVADPQETAVRRIDELKAAMKEETKFRRAAVGYGADVATESEDVYSVQKFIDSAYFKIGGEAPMYQIDDESFASRMRSKLVSSGAMSDEAARKWCGTVLENWKTIADAACDFHRLLGLGGKQKYTVYSEKTKDTAFKNIPGKLGEAIGKIIGNAVKSYGKDLRGPGADYALRSNLTLEADIRNVGKKMRGHIDYMLVRKDGTIEIYNVKASTEPHNMWPKEKREKYCYELAFLKRLLASKGFDPKKIRVNIIPVQLQFNDNFTEVTDINVQNAVSYDTSNLLYTFKEYDSAASTFIASKVSLGNANMSVLDDVTKQIQHIVPGTNIKGDGIHKSAKEWVRRNWKNLDIIPLKEGGYSISLDPESDDRVIITDSRRSDKNEELVSVVEEMLSAGDEDDEGITSAQRVRQDLEESFRKGVFTTLYTGPRAAYLNSIFKKYLDDYELIDDKRVYTWKVFDSPILDEANIIVLQNGVTGQLDVVGLSSVDPSVTMGYNGQKNLLGYYLNDMNSFNFNLDCSYGNIELVRTIALVNAVLPEIHGDVKLGTIKIVSLNDYGGKKGVSTDFMSVLPQWDTIVQVVNGNSPAEIKNNFHSMDVKCLSPEEALANEFASIMSSETDPANSCLFELGGLINKRIRSDGTESLGLLGLSSPEEKVERLSSIITSLRLKAYDKGLVYSDPEKLVDASKGFDDSSKIARMLILAMRAYNYYYDDYNVSNEDYTMLEEYGQRAADMANSSVRRVANIVQNGIDNVNNRIVRAFNDKMAKVFEKFYEECGYGKVRNKVIGDQASVYQNLYQKDEDGKNLFLFKNPYDMSNDLEDHEREFLRNTLFELYKLRCAMNGVAMEFDTEEQASKQSTLPKNYLYVPLQKVSGATKKTAWFRDPAANFEDSAKRFWRALTHPVDYFQEKLGYLMRSDQSKSDEDVTWMRVYNPYKTYDSNIVLRDELVEKYGEGYFETNVENIFIDFLEKQVQSEEYNAMLVRIKGIELAITMQAMDEDKDKTKINKTLKTIDDFVKLNVYNKSIMEPTMQAIDTFLTPLRRAVSKIYIAGNFMGAVRDVFQGIEENFLMSAIKYQTDIGADDVARAFAEVYRDSVTHIFTAGKLNQFNIKWAISNFDASKVSDRLKRGRFGILNAGNYAYATLRAPDYLNRMCLFVAKMIHDGSYDAYSLDDDGRLVYDWRMDKRFSLYASGDMSDLEKYNEQRSNYFQAIRRYNMENPDAQLAYTDDLPDAYSTSEIRQLKTISESIYGSYDKAMRQKLEYVAVGRNFMYFTTWMNGIVNTYFQKKQISGNEFETKQETDYNGNPLFLELDETGKPTGVMTTVDTGVKVMKDVPIMVQGVFGTIGDIVKTVTGLHKEDGVWSFDMTGDGKMAENIARLKKDVWSNACNRRNIRRAITDLLMSLLVTILYKEWLTPEYEEHKRNDDGNNVIGNAVIELVYKGGKASYDSFTGPYAVIDYLDNSIRPTAFELQGRIVKDLFNVLSGDKTFTDKVFSMPASFRSFQDTYRMYIRENKNK